MIDFWLCKRPTFLQKGSLKINHFWVNRVTDRFWGLKDFSYFWRIIEEMTLQKLTLSKFFKIQSLDYLIMNFHQFPQLYQEYNKLMKLFLYLPTWSIKFARCTICGVVLHLQIIINQKLSSGISLVAFELVIPCLGSKIFTSSRLV